jgi:cytochrome c oxidase cbb3-type subunit 3
MRTTASYIRLLVFAVVSAVFLMYVGFPEEPLKAFSELWFWAICGLLILLAIAIEVCVAALQRVLYFSLNEAAQKRYDEKEALAKANQFKWFKEKYKASLGSKAIEEEHEIILDHNYDGIQELDNKLPPWWVYMFYATMVFAVIYLVRFEVFDDYDQAEEYEVAVAQAKIEIEEWKKTAKDLVDVNTVTLLTDASDLNIGKTIFNERCVACHKSDGGGGIGPNLTDNHWILGGGIKNVFNTISEGGRSGKGMVPWKTELKPAQMAQVASYVLSLQGTTPADPKAPEGEIWIDPDAPVLEAPPAQVKDSTAIQEVVKTEGEKVIASN